MQYSDIDTMVFVRCDLHSVNLETKGLIVTEVTHGLNWNPVSYGVPVDQTYLEQVKGDILLQAMFQPALSVINGDSTEEQVEKCGFFCMVRPLFCVLKVQSCKVY